MASRYGRNQKRRHREMIMRQEAEACVLINRAVRAEQKAASLNAEMRDWDERITDALGHYSAFRRKPPEVVTNVSIRELAEEPSWNDYATMRVDVDVPIAHTMCYRRNMVQRFALEAFRQPREARTAVKLIETNSSGVHVAYVVDDETAKRFGPADINQFSRMIAHHLVAIYNDMQGGRE